MGYPELVISRDKLAENVRGMLRLCKDAGVSVCAVTKCICSIPEITQIYYDAGVRQFADSRIQNLKKLSFAGITKILLRLPMPSEAAEVVKYADISLNSEIETIKLLSAEAVKCRVRHGIVLMVDLGDLREGVWPDDAVKIAGEALKLPGIELLGVGSNLNCYGGIIPTVENLSQLVEVAMQIEQAYDVRLKIISGGNSGSIHLITSGTLPERVNNLRIGEALLLGCETSYQQKVSGMNEDVFRLRAQIVELKEKPSVPIGEFGLDAFGEKPVFADKGRMRRAIVACGRQDVSADKISPVDTQIEIIGSSSDHMIIDMTHADRNYAVGDIVEFTVTYGSLLSLCTSEYVGKAIIA